MTTKSISGPTPVSRSRVAAVALAATAFAVFTLSSGLLPTFAFRADVIVSMAIGVALIGVMAGAVVTARPAASRLLWVAGLGLACAVVGTAFGVVALSDLGKIVFGVGAGYWLGSTLAELTDDVRLIVGLAVVIGVLDAASVFLPQGPTHLLLTKAPQTVTYFVVAFPTIGYSVHDAYSGLGTSDLIFFGLFLAAAVGYGLRVRLTLVAMVASYVVTVAVALWTRALPALPGLSLAFLAVNADLIAHRWRASGDGPTASGGRPESPDDGLTPPDDALAPPDDALTPPDDGLTPSDDGPSRRP